MKTSSMIDIKLDIDSTDIHTPLIRERYKFPFILIINDSKNERRKRGQNITSVVSNDMESQIGLYQ